MFFTQFYGHFTNIYDSQYNFEDVQMSLFISQVKLSNNAAYIGDEYLPTGVNPFVPQPTPPSPSPSKNLTWLWILLSIVIVAGIISCIAVYCCRKRQHDAYIRNNLVYGAAATALMSNSENV